MDHAAFLLQQIIERSPDGVRTTSRDPESGSDRIWYRVRVPVLREMVKQWQARYQEAFGYEDWLTLLDTLYRGESIDERQVAGMILAAFPDHRRRLPLDKLEFWIGQLAGWKEVDSTCQSTFGASELLAAFDDWEALLIRLSYDENIAKRRASLVLLVKSIKSPHPCFLQLALRLIDTLKYERDKRITKAVSWLLRSGLSRHPAEIAAYLGANAGSLPAIALRETRRKLKTGRK